MASYRLSERAELATHLHGLSATPESVRQLDQVLGRAQQALSSYQADREEVLQLALLELLDQLGGPARVQYVYVVGLPKDEEKHQHRDATPFPTYDKAKAFMAGLKHADPMKPWKLWLERDPKPEEPYKTPDPVGSDL